MSYLLSNRGVVCFFDTAAAGGGRGADAGKFYSPVSFVSFLYSNILPR
jgi:hypothetical protein